MNLILFLLRISPRAVILSIALGFLSGLANISILALLGAQLSQDHRLSPALVFWGFAGLCIVMPLSRYASEMMLNHLSQDAVLNMRLRLSRQILNAPLRQLEEIGSPRLEATLTEDTAALTHALFVIPRLCMNLIIVLGCLIYLGWLSLWVLAVVLGFMVAGGTIFQVLLLRSLRHQRLTREEADVLFEHFRSLSEGAKELKLHRGRREAFIAELLQPSISVLRYHNLRSVSIITAVGSVGQMLFFILIGVMIFFLPALKALPLASLTTCALVLLYILTPLESVLNVIPILTRAGVSLRKADRLSLTLHAERDEANGIAPPLKEWKRLELADVVYAYHRPEEDESFTLGPLDLVLEQGELVFITGGNGSGKTTLIKLMTALYLPEAGEIRLGGQAITNGNREFYRQHFAVVFSDFHLFDALIGMEADKMEAQAHYYLQQLHLQKKVRIEGGRFSTTKLSQGQRKRLALLTAHLEDRSIYIFDEWAADQDPQFKEVFYYQLLPELKARGKTVVVISHDDRYYHIADRIVKLDNGQLTSLVKPES